MTFVVCDSARRLVNSVAACRSALDNSTLRFAMRAAGTVRLHRGNRLLNTLVSDRGRFVIGYLAFAEVPDLWTWIGAAVIASSAIYIAHRETVRRQSTATTAAASAGSTTVAPTDPIPGGRS